MKKQDMAEAAEQLLAATGWLPALMRTPRTVPEPAESPPPDAVTEAKNRGLLRRRRVDGRAGIADAVPVLSWAIKNLGRAPGGRAAST
jgi:ParB family chromosome partitioning protein